MPFDLFFFLVPFCEFYAFAAIEAFMREHTVQRNQVFNWVDSTVIEHQSTFLKVLVTRALLLGTSASLLVASCY